MKADTENVPLSEIDAEPKIVTDRIFSMSGRLMK